MAEPTEKLLVDIYDRILNRQLTSFNELFDQVCALTQDAGARQTLLAKGYRFLKTVQWGTFADLNAKEYPVLWGELVIAHPKVRSAGDLKRSLSISNIFISMLDIHGYTAFCQQSKKNISKLHELDDFMHTTIREVAKSHGCVGNRERGDEILLVGGRAIDTLRATFEIIQIFAKENFFPGRANTDPSGEYSSILPKFHISAGISGGNLNTPMIITRKGEISGFLLNMAARLQARANKLSPTATRLIIAKTVHTAFEKEQAQEQRPDFTRALTFFDCGPVNFKGVSIANVEVLFKEEQKTKLNYQNALVNLMNSLKQNLWHDKIFAELLQLISGVLQNIPIFTVEVRLPDQTMLTINNEALRKRLTIIHNHYYVQEDYASAIEKLELVVHVLEQVHTFDPLVLEYAQEIASRYARVVVPFRADLDKEIAAKKQAIFNEQERKLYEYLMSNREMLAFLNEKARQSQALGQRKMLWQAHIGRLKGDLDFSLYSGKR